jgi:hypothetical protein
VKTTALLSQAKKIQFQAGSFDPWGGSGGDGCAMFLNAEFERVFNKDDFSFGVKILNLYMVVLPSVSFLAQANR